MVQMSIEVRIQGYGRVFREGFELIDLRASLSMDDKASIAEVTLADPDGSIASDFIAHTMANGGIVPLASPSAPVGSGGLQANISPKNEQEWLQAIVAQCTKSGVTDPAAIAYVLATAKHETGSFRTLVEDSSGSQYEGREDLGNTQPGDGVKYKGRGLAQVTGRINYRYWSKRLNDNFIDNPERLATPSYALVTLVEGMRDGTYTGMTPEGTLIPGGGYKLSEFFGNGKKDFIGARAIINGSDRAALIAGYAEDYLNNGTVNRLLAASGSLATSAPSVPLDNSTPNGQPEVKGAKMLVAMGDKELVYYHQGTEHKSDGTTVLKGVGIRYELARRPKNRTTGQTSLKELAAKVSQASKVPIEWQVAGDVLYDSVAQKGLTDYAFLKQQADQAGLFLVEEQGKVVIKSMDAIVDTNYLYELGVSIVDYSFSDKALDANKTDKSTSSLPSQPKADIDPVSGTLNQSKAITDTEATGKQGSTSPGAKVSDSSKPVATNEAGAKARLQGLPSVLTVAFNEQLKPLDAVRTKGFKETFNRIWLVDKVTHEPFKGTTTLDVYSPVEAPVSSVAPSGPNGQGSQQGSSESNPQGFINPLPGGVFTSPYGPRNGRMHKGVDIATPNPTPQETGLPVVAAASGVVQYANMDYNGGYGGFIEIKHPNGWQTNYAHLSSIELGITPGATVRQGQKIGVEGNTGRSFGVHLHFEILDSSGQHVDPAKHVRLGPLS